MFIIYSGQYSTLIPLLIVALQDTQGGGQLFNMVKKIRNSLGPSEQIIHCYITVI